MGVDVMRWMYARQNVENNLLFGYDKADEVRKRLISFWNIYSFFCTYASLDNFKPHSKNIDEKDLTLLDKWIVSKANLLIKDSTAHYDKFEADKLLKKIELFIDDLSNWYIRRNRRRFWKSENDTDKFVAYQTLYDVLLSLIKLLSPILPFITERMYLNISQDDPHENHDSIHLSSYAKHNDDKIDMDLLKKVETLKKVIESGRATRKKANIKVRQPLSDLKIYENDPILTKFILDQKQLILDELNIKTISITTSLKDMGSFSIKPNFKILSSKFGEEMQTVIKYIATLDQYDVMDKYLNNEQISSGKFDIIKEDILIQIQGHEKEEAFFSNDVMVSISTEIDESLAAEGLIRELIRHVQVMRKEADFNVDDRIVLSGTFSNYINSAIDTHREYLMNEILCTDIVDSLDNSDYNSVFKYKSEKFNIFIKKKL